MPSARRRALLAAVVVCAASAALAAPPLRAQVPPLVPTTTTTTTSTTAPPPATSGPPSGSELSDGSQQAPPGAKDPEGDGAAPPSGGIRVPPEAQRIIDSVPRTGSSSTDGLVASLRELQDLGLSEAETMRVGMGRFPIAGSARYSHDWLFPRYGPGFRFHLGTDVFAAYGTPVRAPVDGIARSANGGLGGLTVKVHMDDGTYFYLAHLSGLADGFVDGMAVRTGDVVGYVGDSGNARGGSPHLHIGIYPHGGPPIDPKPVLDQFIAEAEALVPAVIRAYEQARPTPVPAVEDAGGSASRFVRPLMVTGLFGSRSVAWTIDVLYLSAVTSRGSL